MLRAWARTRECVVLYRARLLFAKICARAGIVQKVTVEADDVIKARLMLEAQYGKGNVTFVGRG